MTNLEAMQDTDLRQMIHDVELLNKLYHSLIIPSEESESILKERIQLCEMITGRWRKLLEED
ncbi:hypothetical protein NVP1193O_059 [Vibrio phage 1.193.O._10N.286.52.C6]|nr:hypothetical protein NVP1193O_059 [Vibrio phage 1.193.O._10N.286.52.C6]